MTKLRDEEAAHALTKAHVKTLEHSLHTKKQEMASLHKDFLNVKERLTLILHQRADVDRIREVLESLTGLSGDDEEEIADNDVEEETLTWWTHSTHLLSVQRPMFLLLLPLSLLPLQLHSCSSSSTSSCSSSSSKPAVYNW